MARSEVLANREQNLPVKGRMGFVSSLVRDLKFALRQMRQTPIVSGVALLSLALGIGANVAIFSLVNALILKPLPVHEPDQLVIVGLERPLGHRHVRHQPAFGNMSAITRRSWSVSRPTETRAST